jgi:hypothetical protein
VVSGVQQCVEKLVLAISPVEVDVLGRAGPLGQAQVKRETALEQPTIWSDCKQTSQQPIEGHPLTIPRYLCSHASGTLLEPPLQGLAKRRRILIPHAVVSGPLNEPPRSIGSVSHCHAQAPGCGQSSIHSLADGDLDLLGLSAGLQGIHDAALR